MSSTSRYRLTMRKGPLPGKSFELAKALLTIGREVKNDIVINDSEVSRQHVRLTEQADGYQVEDLASTNGTFVNGVRLHAAALLKPGDVLGFGGTVELEFVSAPSVDATVMVGQTPAPAGEPLTPSAPPAPVAAFEAPAPAYVPPPEPASAFVPAAPAAGGMSVGGVKIQPWMWAVGGGCVLLAACGCGLAAVLALFGPQLSRLLTR